MKNNLKIIISVVASLLVGLLLGMIINKTFSNEKLTKLPNPEVTGGERGQFGIDKNINEGTIDKYLNRSDSVYRYENAS